MWLRRGTLSQRKIQDLEQQPSAPPKNVSQFTKLSRDRAQCGLELDLRRCSRRKPVPTKPSSQQLGYFDDVCGRGVRSGVAVGQAKSIHDKFAHGDLR
jgi:hypothetical protein